MRTTQKPKEIEPAKTTSAKNQSGHEVGKLQNTEAAIEQKLQFVYNKDNISKVKNESRK